MGSLKEPISNDVVALHEKGKDPRQVVNVSNYFLITNHADAISTTDQDRRYFVLHTKHATASEMVASIPQDYFANLFSFITTPNKIRPDDPEPRPLALGALRKWLMEYEFHPEFDPNGRAPKTEAKALTDHLSVSDNEMSITDVISHGAHGVAENVLSSASLSNALLERGVSVRGQTLHRLLAKMGWRMYKNTNGTNVLKWNGTNHRIWIRGSGITTDPSPTAIRSLLDATRGSDFRTDPSEAPFEADW
jgi:hypothetical protein